MRLRMIAYCLGVTATGLLADLPPVTSLLACFALAICAGMICRRFWPGSVVYSCLLLIACFTAGVTWHSLWAGRILDQHLPAALERIDMRVTGKVLNLPQLNPNYQQFQFLIENNPHGFQGRKILLNYYGPETIEPAQHWQFTVRLNQPHGFANPQTFDYEAWLLQKGITAKGYVRSSDSNLLLPGDRFSLELWRYRIKQTLLEAIAELEYKEIILALVLGDSSQIARSDRDVFTASGTSHLFVISGLHIGFAAAVGYWLSNYLARLFPLLLLLIPAQRVAALCAIVVAGMYSFLAGFTLPTQRALVMVCVFMLNKVLCQNRTSSYSLLLALTLVLSLNPLAAVGAGFWLSFSAVAALLFSFTNRTPDQRKLLMRVWNGAIRSQLVVFTALLVPLAVLMQQTSLVAPVANVVAIPVVSLTVVPLCLLSLLLLPIAGAVAEFLLLVADFELGLLTRSLNFVTSYAGPNVQWSFAVAEQGVYLFAGLACLLLLFPRRWPYRYLALPLLIPLVFPQGISPDPGDLEVHILDVGQGLAVLLRTSDHLLVYDAGPSFSDEFNTGSAVVIPVLRGLGINKIDKLIVSHGDNDHAGGATGLLENMPVGTVTSSYANLESSQPVLPCLESQHWVWDEVEFQFIHPNTVQYRGNDSSCVLKVSTGKHSILLPGDIELGTERRLVAEYGLELKSDILIAPHHGSNSSSSYAFVKMVDPMVVVFSTGYQNRFNHPAERIKQRYSEAGAELFDTADSGMISFTLTEESAEPKSWVYRTGSRRYWF